MGGTEKVDRQSSMRNEIVPEMQGEVRVATTEAGNKVILVGLDGVFGVVCAIQVQRNEWEIDIGIAQKNLGRPGIHGLAFGTEG